MFLPRSVHLPYLGVRQICGLLSELSANPHGAHAEWLYCGELEPLVSAAVSGVRHAGLPVSD